MEQLPIDSYMLLCGAVVQWLSLLHNFIQLKPELRFYAGSNPARGVSEIRDG